MKHVDPSVRIGPEKLKLSPAAPESPPRKIQLATVKVGECRIEECRHCLVYRGWAMEDANGRTSVYCLCDLAFQRRLYGHLVGPGLLCYDGENFWWVPTADHRCSNGSWSHTPHFMAPSPPARIRKGRRQSDNIRDPFEKCPARNRNPFFA